MNLQTVLNELQALGTEQTKKTYKNHGAHEPLFGVTVGAMKPLVKKTGKNYDLSMALYATGNYDAAYFTVTLAEADCAQSVADRWIKSEKELYMSAGWSCYCWLLGVRPDDSFDKDKLQTMLHFVGQNKLQNTDCTRLYP